MRGFFLSFNVLQRYGGLFKIPNVCTKKRKYFFGLLVLAVNQAVSWENILGRQEKRLPKLEQPNLAGFCGGGMNPEAAPSGHNLQYVSIPYGTI
jgi:hypothetical protein